jgi:hypothetical protein
MHRIIQDHLEEVLASTLPAGHQVLVHLKDCGECREETAAMRAQNELLHAWKIVDESEPRPGFYARVLERIELQRPVSIWALFTDSLFGRRLAMASLAVALLMGVYVVSAEQDDADIVAQNAAVEMDPLYPSAGFAREVMSANASNSGAVFISLVSYQER